MEFVTGQKKKNTVEIADILREGMHGNAVKLRGAVHTVRDMRGFSFLVLRNYGGLVQCVADGDSGGAVVLAVRSMKEGTAVEASGVVRAESRAPNGFELHLTGVDILSEPEGDAPLPLPIAKRKLNASLETKLSLRPLSLRNLRERAVFKLQEGIVRGFRDFLFSEHFTEVHTPKIVAGNAEGGANVFQLEYFRKRAFLAQSPQFYKQTLVGVYDRVFEVGPVLCAEKHNTARHLNEYTGLDLEMGYIDSFTEIMETETAMLSYTIGLLFKEYARELAILGIELPSAGKIPSVRFDEAKRLAAEKYSRRIRDPYDLEPEEEALIGRYFKEEYGSDFVFVTHYPSRKRPFYAMDDPADEKFTLSFDLLFRGMEITTGGQRIHDYGMLKNKMKERGMEPDDFAGYLMIFQYGMPPHGGLGIGLERLTMQLLGEGNVRETAMFPRDVNRLTP